MTTDVRKLVERLREHGLPQCSFDGGKTWELDGVAIAERLAEAASVIEAQAEEIEDLCDAVRLNLDTSLSERSRAEAAERECDALKAENGRLRAALRGLLIRIEEPDEEYGPNHAVTVARAALHPTQGGE